ncbi:JmjC domain-containing protein [Actinoplanes sp. NPDC020271]|uniref:JmjC domain-containing protein n=1 Tax=Actinoplanes sp. NPDC020271 TaxID=3363896 RepID=UPI0037B4D968
MPLELLLDSRTAEEFMNTWPDTPQKLTLPAGGLALTRVINANTVREILDSGCYPATDVNVIKNDNGVHPRLFASGDRLDPVKLKQWRDRGYTVQMRHLERWLSGMATITRSIQQQTGCVNYVSAFVTPAGRQGLGHHWDQYLSVVVQLAGTKTWDIWKPRVANPTRAHLTTVQLWQDDWVQEWADNGPDMSFDLAPHQVLVLPRGWIHSPHSRGDDESVHLTFVIKERTPLWIAERLTATVIEDAAFRQAVPPTALSPEALVDCVGQTRDMLIKHLSALDTEYFARLLRVAADTEVDQDLI